MTLILPIFGELKKGKLHILKKIGLSTFKEIFKIYIYNSTLIFFNILLFCLKGYSETLNKKPTQKLMQNNSQLQSSSKDNHTNNNNFNHVNETENTHSKICYYLFLTSGES